MHIIQSKEITWQRFFFKTEKKIILDTVMRDCALFILIEIYVINVAKLARDLSQPLIYHRCQLHHLPEAHCLADGRL